MDWAKEFLQSSLAAASTRLDNSTPNELAIASIVGLVGLFVVLNSSRLRFRAILAAFLSGYGYAFYAVPTLTAIITLAAVVMYALYGFWVFGEWEKAFSGHRLDRRNEACPSNNTLPDIKSMEENKAKILDRSKWHANYDSCQLLHTVAELEVTKKENTAFRARAKRTGTLTASKAALLKEQLEKEMGEGSLGTAKAKELDMDHVYVRFKDFLWGYIFIVPFSFLLWKRGTIVLQFRLFLKKIGLINPMAKCDYEALAATLCLEQTQAIHYYSRGQEGSELENIAGFFFADFPYVDNNCDFQIANLFAVDIDLETKRFVKAKLDDEVLNAKEACILLWYNTIAAQHVKLHAMANWGANLDDSLEGVNSFLRQNSVVTTMYNYFGYSMFSRFLEIWAKQGILSPGWASPEAPLIKSFNHGIKENVWQHAHIEALTKHSRFIRFVIQVRAIFLAEFQKQKHLFPGIDGEAMFVGTVLHSLDHTLMDWNLKDALYLDTEDPRFGKMAELGQVVKVGFVSDVDGLYFHKRFKDSGHPFYDTVYEKAAKIDKLLADNMDTCIVK